MYLDLEPGLVEDVADDIGADDLARPVVDRDLDRIVAVFGDACARGQRQPGPGNKNLQEYACLCVSPDLTINPPKNGSAPFTPTCELAAGPNAPASYFADSAWFKRPSLFPKPARNACIGRNGQHFIPSRDSDPAETSRLAPRGGFALTRNAGRALCGAISDDRLAGEARLPDAKISCRRRLEALRSARPRPAQGA